MQGRYTPSEYDDLETSWGLDPPVEDLLRELLRMVAQLLADQRNIHRGKDAPVAHAADFLPPEPKDEDEDDGGDEQPEQPVVPDTMAAFGAKATGMGLLRGHGARPPGAAMGAFFKPEE